jgi:hypothetical protein
MSEDEERERGQGQTLPPHTALQLVLSYCVHHCYAGTVRVRPTARSPSCPHPHSVTRSTWLGHPCMRPSVSCGVLAACSRTHFPPAQAIESSCQPPQRHGHTGDDGEGGDGDDDTVGTGKRLRGLATQWHPHDEQQRAPIVNHVLEGNVQQVRHLACVPSLPLSPLRRRRTLGTLNARHRLAVARQAMELLEQCAPGLLAKHPEVRQPGLEASRSPVSAEVPPAATS